MLHVLTSSGENRFQHLNSFENATKAQGFLKF